MAMASIRWWNVGVVVVWLTLLGLPMAGHWRSSSPPAQAENRRLAPAVSWPASLAEAKGLPAAVQAWLHDHFGFRHELLVAHNRLNHLVFGSFPAGALAPGKDGYLFLGSKGLAHRNTLRTLCGADAVPVAVIHGQLRRLLAVSRAAAPVAQLLLVPDKARLKPEKLPQWLQDECAGFAPPVQALLAEIRQDPGMDPQVFYPFDVMRLADQVRPVYHPWNLHWDHQGAQPVADWLAQTRWSLPRRVEVPLVEVLQSFDLQQFAPGLSHWHTTQVPAYDNGNMLVCRNSPECFPELAEEAAALFQVARFRSASQLPPEQRRPRLVILGDSFGEAIAEPLAPYFAEVWYLSMNNLPRLSPAQKRRLRHVAFDLFQPDVLLHVYSEQSIFSGRKGYFRDVTALLDPVNPPPNCTRCSPR
jgi:hypothetical protein